LNYQVKKNTMADIQSIVNKMTLEEKAALCTGKDAWSTLVLERLGVPEMRMSDGPHGLRRIPQEQMDSEQGLPATCFPTASCMAATWNVDLLHEIGQALGEECLAQNVDIVLGPGTNMKRTPLCGRNFEYYSEDPFLSGELAAGFISGVQSKGVGTSLKHFAANSQEFQRFSISASIDERSLREIYLPAFETAVKKAKPWTVMCAYNRLNGSYCSEHHKLLVDILKKEWGFEGLVVSDWGAVHDRVAALQGGLDLEMPGPRERRVKTVVEAVRAGVVDEAILDESVRRILGIVFKAAETPKVGDFDAEAHHLLARKVAAEGMVLLKNDGILPLGDPKHIAVIGLAAKNPYVQGIGSSHVTPTRVDIPFDEIRKLAGGAELSFSEGYPANYEFQQALIDEAVKAAQIAEVALIFIALPAGKEAEGYDRGDIELTPQQVALIKAVTKVQPQTIVILNNGSAVTMDAWIGDTPAVLEAWMMGQAGGSALADILFGRDNPSGKLSETFPLKLADTPSYINYPGENGEVRYGEGLFIGYRYYDSKEIPVLFPFGHGISYTTFDYSSPRVSATSFRDVDGLTVSVDVSNTGKFAGKEIVQVYVHDQKSRLVRPKKELKGFAKVELQPGETKTVTVTLDFRSFAYYNPAYRQWVVEDGEFDILIGASSADIRFSETVTLKSSMTLPSKLHRESTVNDWLSDPRGKVVFEPIYRLLVDQVRKVFGDGDGESDAATFQLMGNAEMPLLSVLQFQESDLPLPAEELVNMLLGQIYGSNE
jgi:beta-glucosidase